MTTIPNSTINDFIDIQSSTPYTLFTTNNSNNLFSSFDLTPSETLLKISKLKGIVKATLSLKATRALINLNSVTMNKSADLLNTTVGTTVTYTIAITNGSTIPISNTTLFDPNTSTGVNFANDSVTINGAAQAGANPQLPTGVSVGTIAAGATSTVSFQIIPITVPNPNPISNTANISYDYILTPGVTDNGVLTSNIANTNVFNPGLVTNKQTSLTYATVGDTITYTLTLNNTGNIDLHTVSISDTIPLGTTFLPNSVTLNGIPQLGEQPNTGIPLGTVIVGASPIVTFQVIVNTLPTINPVPNNATSQYSYVLGTLITTANSYANEVFTTIANSIIVATKNSSPTDVTVGDTIAYTIQLDNNGNVAANNVTVIDTIPSGTTFLPNTLNVNNTPFIGNPNPPGGINIGSIGNNSSVTITFQVIVNTIPNINPVPNSSNIAYQFAVGANNVARNVNSNVITTTVSKGIINPIKQFSPANVTVGDTITYTLLLNSTGNVPVTNVVVIDTVPLGGSFVANSMQINGAASPNTPDNINIPSINPGTTSTITFNVTVATIPTINPMPNIATVNYNFNVGTTPLSDTIPTNLVTTPVSKGNLISSKAFSPSFTTVGDTITYTISLSSNGNVPVTNVIFTDTIPLGTTFINNSLSVNGIPQLGANPNPPGGTNLGSINAFTTSTVSFQVVVNTIPTINPIPNSATALFNYSVGPTIVKSNNSTNTNIVTTPVSKAIINSTKSSSPANVTLGDTITYTISLTNIGNVPANAVIFNDTVPNGTSFINGSLQLNGAATPGTPDGVNIGTIPASSTTTITFQLTVETIPTPNPIPNSSTTIFSYVVSPTIINNNSSISNLVTNNVSYGNVNLLKQFSPANVTVGDTITYNITLSNPGNVPVTNVIFIDTTPIGTSFIPNSVTLNSMQLIGENPNPPNGINIASINANSISTISFKVAVNTIPTPNPIPNSGTAIFRYAVGPTTTNNSTSNSNVVTTPVSQGNIISTKSVTPNVATVGDTLNYTIVLQNPGNVPVTNIIFTDTIPSGTNFIPNSVSLNGVSQLGANPSPPTGINVNSINPNASSTITFQVTVTTIPTTNPIPNSGTVAFNYSVGPTIVRNSTSNTNIVTVPISLGNLVSNKIGSPSNVTVGDTITYSISLTNTGNVPVTNIIFTDTIPPGTTFVNNSVAINGNSSAGSNPTPPTGINIPPINSNSQSNISFQVVVNTIPTPNPILNSSNTVFSYNLSPTITRQGNTNSNVITTPVSLGKLTASKSFSPANVTIGDTIIYTVSLSSLGNVPVNNVIFIDTIPLGTSFIPNSVTLNGITNPGANPNPPNGVNVGTINNGLTTTLAFQVVVNTLPTINPIPNSATTLFNYSVGPTIVKNGSYNTNVVTTPVSAGFLNSIKDLSPSNVTVGDTITYTISLFNTGNVDLSSLVLSDTIPIGTSYIPNSLTINGANQPGANPSNLNIGTLNTDSGTTITFKVIVNTIPNPNPILNSATSIFNYSIGPTIIATGNSNTNIVSANVSSASLNSFKYVSPSYVTVGDTITYTISSINTGNVSANNTIISDTIPSGTSFIPNSITLNGAILTGATPNNISLGSINPNSTATITFKVTVTTIPTPNPIPNSATGIFVYSVGPTIVNNGNTNTNLVTTPVSKGSMTANKSVTPTTATLGDTITYTLVFTSTGNVDLNNVIINDTIPQGTSLIPNSVTINSVTKPGATTNNLNIGSIVSGSSSTVTFQVTVNTIPNPNPIPNLSTAMFNYSVGPTIVLSDNTITNTVYTNISYSDISSFKTSDQSFVTLGDTITYTVSLNSNGNVPVNNVVFVDTIPLGTTLIPNSVTVNGAVYPGANPSNLLIGSINANSTSTVSFQVKVNTIPNPNPIPNVSTTTFSYNVNPTTPINGDSSSNTTYTKVNYGELGQVKYASNSTATIGDTITYTLVLSNSGNIPTNNIIIIDTIPSGTIFKNNSVTLNGVVQPGANPSPPLGYTINSINPSSTSTVTFQVIVTTIPNPNIVTNIAQAYYSYTVDPSFSPITCPITRSPIASNSVISNPVNTTINAALINSSKSVDKSFADLGTTITYSIVIENNGNVAANNVLFYDSIPFGTTFIANSVTVNSIPQPGGNPQTGISLNSIPAVSTLTVSYKVLVNNIMIPNPNPVPNYADISFNFDKC